MQVFVDFPCRAPWYLLTGMKAKFPSKSLTQMMPTTLRPCLILAAILALSTAAASAEPVQLAGSTRTTSTYSCGAGLFGECPFLLYTSDCKEAPARNGHPSLVCTHAVFAEFKLKNGESKTFKDIPPNVKQCQPRNGKLSFPDCLR